MSYKLACTFKRETDNAVLVYDHAIEEDIWVSPVAGRANAPRQKRPRLDRGLRLDRPRERIVMNDIASHAALQLPAISQAFGGGIFAGRFFVDNQAYALIVAPKDIGERDETAWNKSLKNVAGATSYCDGFVNTGAMAAAGSELAKWARALVIDGVDDWYLPSRLETLLAFSELKGTDKFDFERDWYWTSTQLADDAEYAWCQDFNYGTQRNYHEYGELRARAVRRVPIR